MSDTKWHAGQPIEGWGTVGIYDGEVVVYGGFATKEIAEAWLSKLKSGAVVPIYSEAYNRG